jgi:hypothetical protein
MLSKHIDAGTSETFLTVATVSCLLLLLLLLSFSEHDEPSIPGTQLTHIRPRHLLEPVPTVKRIQSLKTDEPRCNSLPIHSTEPMLEQLTAQPLALELGVDAQGGEVPGLAAAIGVHDAGLDLGEDAGEGVCCVGVQVWDGEEPVLEGEE